jgi:hypothetical protein
LSGNYETIISASERVAWRIEDILPPNQSLDFTMRFLPESLVRAHEASFLSSGEKLKLNQVRGNSYAHLFQFVEEYIVATCVQHVDAEIFGDETTLRAMLRFAEEEVKHQLLFKRFLRLFAEGFGSPCEGIPSQEAVAGVILSKTPMAVLLITLHLELMTQQHYTECVRDSEDNLDPTFKKMLKSHWAEESQHAKIDAMTLRKLASTSTPEIRAQAAHDYLDLIDALSGLLGQQAELDTKNLERAIQKELPAASRATLFESQKRAYLQTFVAWGMASPLFVSTVAELFPEDAGRITQKAAEVARACVPVGAAS